MARAYAQVKVSIWDDDSDFGRLTPNAKLLYLHLISRRDLSLAGHLFIREQRWADACFAGDIVAINDAMTDLITNRYVLVDTKTGELMVRTFIRHDGGYRNSKMRKAIEGAIGRIESVELSTAAGLALARCVNGDPEPPSPQVEGQHDHQSDDQSEETSDQTTDPTCSPRPAACNLQPAAVQPSSSSESDLQPPVNKPEVEEEDLISKALIIVAEKVTKLNNASDPFRYKQSIIDDPARRADLERIHSEHDAWNAEQIAAFHGGRELARVNAMTEPDIEPQPIPVSTYEPPPPVPPATVVYCEGCNRPAAMMRALHCKLDPKPDHCADVATVRQLRPETA